MAIRRAPGFVATAGLTLAIGIGAVVTMASVYSQAVVHPIHVPDPDNLLSLYAVHRSVNFVPPALSWNRFEALRRQSATLTQLAAYSNESVAFSGPGITPEQWRALRVSGDFFGATGLLPLRGRVFTADDDVPNGPAVCVLSYDIWQARFGAGDIVGRLIFFPFAQLPRPTPAIVARSAGNPAELSRVFTAAVAEVDPSLPVARFASMDERLQQTLGPDRILAILASAFAVVAVVLAAVGLYAVLAHGVAARRREIGIRMAIGASRPSIVRLIVTQAARLAGAGVAVGLLGGAGASKLLQSQLFGVTARDGWIFVATTAGFAAIGLAAAWLPARRASRVDPLSALGGR